MNANLIPPVSSLAHARRKCARGTLLAAIAVIALLSLAFLAALDLWVPFSRNVRVGIAAVSAAAILIAIVRGWRVAWMRHTPGSAAQAIEAARPDLGQQIRTALEVAERGVQRHSDPETQLFAKRLLTESQASLAKQSWRSLIPSGRAIVWIFAALAVAGAMMFGAKRSPDFRLALSRLVTPSTAPTYTELSWSIAPNVFDERHPPRMELRVERRLAEPRLFVRERGGEWVETPMTPLPDGRSWDIVLSGRHADLEVYATAGDAQTPPHTLTFKPIPKLVAVRTKLVFPEYTGRAPETRNLGDVSAVEDTKVQWEFVFNVVPDRVEWSIGTDPASPLKVDPATKTATVEWKAGMSRANAIVSVSDTSGEPIDSWRYMAEGFADALPSVELLEPVKDSEATSVTELPVRIRAKDDFGVSEVGLILEAAGHRDWVLERVISERDQRTVTEIASAMLEKVPLTIRDNVRLYAYALDHKPRGGPRSVSPLRSIDIREFKKRWMFQESDGGFGGRGNRQRISDGLMKLGEIISSQRGVVSDTFLLRETIRSTGAAVTSSALPIGQREAELSSKAVALREEWLNSGGFPMDDVMLLDTGATQMQEAALSLGLKGPANVDKGFTTTDRALSTLLQLRKRLLTILQKGSQGEKPKSEEQLRPLADLAREAERLAREERDMHDQLAPEAVAGTNLEATRRQHEVALSDAGELYAVIVDHPQINDPVIRLMGDAEKAMQAADQKLRGEQVRDSRPELALAERRLLEVAQFLRAMELTEVNETLRKLANEAEKNAGETRKASQGKSEGGTESGEKGQAAAKNDSLPQAARDTQRTDEILGALAEKAGGRNQTSDVEDSGTAGSLGETLSVLRDQVAAGKLAQELKSLAEAQQKGQSDAGSMASQGDAAAGKLDAMAREFRETAKRLEATRAANLAAAQAQARELQKQLAAAGDKQGDKGAGAGKKGEGNKPGDKPGLAKAGGKGPGEKPGDGAGKGNKPGEKPGSRGGKGDKPGEQGLAKSDQPGKAGPGGKPEDNKQGGRGGISGDQENAKEGPGGQAMGRFAKTLRSVGDEQLNNFAIKLFNAPFSLDSLPDVEAAAARIQELIAELPATGGPVASAGRLPESRRREVEDYFRSLSDDFGSEQWDAPKKPGENAE